MRLGVVAALLATLLTAAPADADSVHVPRAYFGVHDASTLAYGRLPVGSVRLWDAGVAWDDVEITPGVYDFTRLDELVATARAHHVQVTLTLGQTPAFYAASRTLPPVDPAVFDAYVRAVMTRYRGQIHAYQVWNEGNISTFWTGTPAELAQLTSIVDTARDQLDQAATVVAPSFAVAMRYQLRWMGRFQRQVVDGRPVWAFYDANGLSLYPRHGGGPEAAMRLLARARGHLARAGVPSRKPVWASEVNYGVAGGNILATQIPAAEQAANVMRTYILGAARGLERVFWYRYDWGARLGDTLLARPLDYTQLTRAGRAYRTTRAWLRGRLAGCRHDRLGTYRCHARYAGHDRLILWNPHRRVWVHVRGAVHRVTRTGVRVRFRGRATIHVHYVPVMVSHR